MRLIMLLAAIAGALLAFGYPAWLDLFPGREIGTYSLSTTPGDPAGPTLRLAPRDAPVGAVLSLAAAQSAAPPPEGGRTVSYALLVESDGEAVHRATADLAFVFAPDVRTGLPVRPEQETFLSAFEPAAEGDYRFRLTRTDSGALALAETRLVLRRNAAIRDERIAPAGYILLVLGAVGFVVLGRRRRAVIEPHPPRENRWGRQ